MTLQGDWLDGPGLVKWIVERQPDDFRYTMALPERISRRWTDWKRGKSASVYAADEALIHLGHHLSELPDELYRRHPNATMDPSRRRKITDKQRMEVATLLGRGFRPFEVAAKTGISDRTVRKIRDAMRVGA